MSSGQELAHRDEGGAITSSEALSDTERMLTMMRELALNPDVDATKLETIARVANEQQDRAERRQFAASKGAAMSQMPAIRKDGRIVIAKQGEPERVQGTFAKWPDLQRAITPVLERNGLVLSHDIDHEGAVTLVTPVLTDIRTGYEERGGKMALPLDTSGGKNNTQGAGSAASYGKRHTTIALLGIRLEDVDDDGGLMARADEPLNDQQQRLVDVAEERAKNGADTYNAWFARLDPRDKRWMIETGRHADLGGAAPVASIGSAAPSAAAGKVSKHNVETADGWTAQYEDDCAAAASLMALADVKRRGDRGLARLQKGNPKLYDRCDAAFETARQRLSSADDGLFSGGNS